jgi:hypothetical protein
MGCGCDICLAHNNMKCPKMRWKYEVYYIWNYLFSMFYIIWNIWG